MTLKVTALVLFLFSSNYLFAQEETNVFYKCFNADKNVNLQLSVAYDKKTEKPMYLQYRGKGGAIALKALTPARIKNQGITPSVEETYQANDKGRVVGTFYFTHQGNWDYITHINKSDGKKTNFTIDFETSVVNDAYRITPCYLGIYSHDKVVKLSTAQTQWREPTGSNYPAYTVITAKSFVYSEADVASKTSTYIVKGDDVKLVKRSGNFANVEYQNNKTGLVTNYWILFNTLIAGQNPE